MNKFSIIPVLDLLNSQVVHAVKGNRSDYKPLKSHLFESNNLEVIISTLFSKFHFDEVYIADLDAIVHKSPNYEIFRNLIKLDINIMIDLGISDEADFKRFLKYNFAHIIVGLETVTSIKVIKNCLEISDPGKLIVSIDMYNGVILSNSQEFKRPVLKIINKLEKIGVEKILLLDLFRVGQKIGGLPKLYLEIKQLFCGDTFIGGGVRELKDLIDYKIQGFSGVLVGTALYDGSISIEDLSNLIDKDDTRT